MIILDQFSIDCWSTVFYWAVLYIEDKAYIDLNRIQDNYVKNIYEFYEEECDWLKIPKERTDFK